MRYITLDTETTGLKVEEGHRVIEIGCVELVNRQASERQLHRLINPEREVDEGAAAIHGFTWDHLKDKPRFQEVAHEFVSFIKDATLVIHNAPFDLGFLNTELARVGLPPVAAHAHEVIDSLALARQRHPGQRNSLDALCQRYGIPNTHRVLHGALLDAALLAQVFLAMTRGQESLEINEDDAAHDSVSPLPSLDLSRLLVRPASASEQSLHEAYMAQLRPGSGASA